MKFQIRRELVEKGQERFEKYAEELELRLQLQGVPLCRTDLEALNQAASKQTESKQTTPKQTAPKQASSNPGLLRPVGLSLLQYRFRKKDRLRTKWVTKKIPKHSDLDKCCQWNLLPVHIVPKKEGNPEHGLIFCYLLQEAWITSNGEKGQRLCLIETDEKGYALKKHIQDQTSPHKPPFSFPRHYLAKINHVLAMDFLGRYWNGGTVPFWHFTKEGIAYYLGSGEADFSYDTWHGLQQLLDSDAGDLAAILTAFHMFAVMKPFFPQFHRLDRHSTYLEGKKYFKQQFALSLCSADLEKASTLARMCCIDPNILPHTSIIDGVRIYDSSPQKQNREISFAEYEATVLQKAGVLWVGHRPSEAVQRAGGVLALELPACAVFPTQNVLSPLLAQLTAHIHDRSIDDFRNFCTEVFFQAEPIVNQLLMELQRAVEQYDYPLEEGKLENWENNFRRQNGQLPPDPLRAVQRLRDEIYFDVEDLWIDANQSAQGRIVLFRAECEKLFQRRIREIKKIKGKCQKNVNSLDSEYQTAWASLEKYDTVTRNMRPHLAYLLASYDVFLRYCAPESQRVQRLAQLEQALIRACSNIPGLPVGEILEQYLSALLASGRCARLRGQGSERADVCLWYDPKERTLLLPARTYFDALCQCLPQEYTCTKRVWEAKLEQANLLKTVSRKDQIRRTFEVRTRGDDSKKISVLKIRLDSLSHRFLTSEPVLQALRRMAEDSSPYRVVANLLEK